MQASIRFLIVYAAPYSSPQNLSAASLTSTSITLHWLPPPDHLLNGIIRYYHILISDPTEVTVHDSLVDGGELEVFVDDLHPYFLYNCSIAAVTVEDGPPSSIQILTLEDGELIVLRAHLEHYEGKTTITMTTIVQ